VTGDIGQITVSGANAVFARTNLVPFQVTMTDVERVDFRGLEGDDSLSFGSLAGTSVTQVLFSGGAGDDKLNADTTTTPISADGGDGNDAIFTGSGDDSISGGDGLDRLFGGGGNDTIIDDIGASSELNGGAGNDTIYGGAGNDYITGGDGNDTISGGTDGQDSLFGGAGNDYIVAADADNNGIGSVLDGGAGSNQLYSLVGSGKDYAVGGEGADTIVTGGGSDIIFGNDGNDTILAGTGTDYIYGGAGNDLIYTDDLITNSQDFVYVSGLSGFGTGIDTVTDFKPGAGGDVAVIVGTPGLTSFAQVQAKTTTSGLYSAITLSNTDQLYLYNVTPGQLTADNFLFL
jgi:Ca2+-binding RTX toxin-like protein